MGNGGLIYHPATMPSKVSGFRSMSCSQESGRPAMLLVCSVKLEGEGTSGPQLDLCEASG